MRQYQSGQGFFVGHRYQKGNGFFGKVIKNAIFPFLKYLGKQGVKTAVAIGEDAFRNPSDIKSIAKTRLKEAGMQAIDDGANRIKEFVQTGKGIKRKSENIKGTAAKKRKTSEMKVIASRKRKPTKPKKLAKRLSKPKKAIKGRRKPKSYKFLKRNGTSSR